MPVAPHAKRAAPPAALYMQVLSHLARHEPTARWRSKVTLQAKHWRGGNAYTSAGDMRLHKFITDEVSGQLLKSFAGFFLLSRESVAALLDTTPKTVRSRETSEKLPVADVERIARYVRVWTAACGTFEDEEYARQWLHNPSEALGNKVPFALLSTGDGERLALDELGRIEHGLPV